MKLLIHWTCFVFRYCSPIPFPISHLEFELISYRPSDFLLSIALVTGMFGINGGGTGMRTVSARSTTFEGLPPMKGAGAAGLIRSFIGVMAFPVSIF